MEALSQDASGPPGLKVLAGELRSFAHSQYASGELEDLKGVLAAFQKGVDQVGHWVEERKIVGWCCVQAVTQNT